MQEGQNKPRNKDLTSAELQRLRKLPQYLQLNEKEFILYNLVEKQSNSGLFKNERLLLLNARQQSLCYLSKLPPSLIPFKNEEEVNQQQSKQKLLTNQTYQNGENRLSCRALPDKNGIEIKVSKSDRKIQWIYYFTNRELMDVWFDHIHFLFTRSRQEINQRYHASEKKIEDKQPSPQKQDPSRISHNSIGQNSKINSNKSVKSQKEQPQIKEQHMEKSEIEQIQHSDEKQSQYNEFSQNAPLGKFVRQNKKYNSQAVIDRNNNKGSLYYTTPQGQNTSNHKSNPLKSNKQEEGLPIIRDDLRSVNNHYIPSNPLKIPSKEQFNSKQSISKENLQSISFRKRPNNLKQVDWNGLYYSNRDQRAKVYFDFLNQCIKYTTQLVDKLPLTKSIHTFDSVENYFFTQSNGIGYKIAYGKQDSSLIYELSDNNPIVGDNYEIYDDLKSQFYEQRQFFFKNYQQQPALSCFIDYKGLSFLCKACKPENSLTKSNKSFKRSNVNEDALLKKMENLDLFIVSTSDFQDIMRYLNSSNLNWGYLYHQTDIKQFKIQFVNEMFSQIFANITKSQLCHIYESHLFDQFQQGSLTIVEEAVTDSILMLVNRLFGYGKESDQLWQIIIHEVERKYKISTTMDSILPGYLLYSVIYKLGIKVQKNVNMKTTFIMFKKNYKTIQKQHINGFKPIVHCLNYEQMSTLFHQIKENLQSSHENNQQLQLLINNEQYESIPTQVRYLSPKINIQLSKTHPYNSNGESILIYESMICDTPTEDHYQIVLSAISWLLQAEKHHEAFDLAFIKIEELIFWTGKVPIISLFYESFAEYFLAHDDVEKAVEQYRLSIKTLTQIFGPNNIKLLKKKFDLSTHFSTLNRKDDCLKELGQCKQICENNNYEQSSIYIKILLKMAKMSLSLSKCNDSIALSMICLKRLQSKVEDEQIFESEAAACQFLQVGELLLRSFELTNKRQELFEVISLCAQRCQNVDSLKAYKRLFRIILFPYLKRLSLKQSQIYMMIVQQLNAAYKQSNLREQQLYECMRARKMLIDINTKMKNNFKNIVKMHDDIIKKKILEEYLYCGDEYFLNKSDKNDVEQFLKETFFMTNLIGIGFVQGMLKDVYYD